jgi:hypothetical protein
LGLTRRSSESTGLISMIFLTVASLASRLSAMALMATAGFAPNSGQRQVDRPKEQQHALRVLLDPGPSDDPAGGGIFDLPPGIVL